MKKSSSEKILDVKSELTANGLTLNVKNRKFATEYPKEVWQKMSRNLQQVLLENISFCETNFLPLILGYDKIRYNFNYPLLEAAFFQNQIFDLLDCEQEDKVKQLTYLKQFYNLEYEFKSHASAFFDSDDIPKFRTSKPKAVLLFSFGKESLTTLALCLELGIEPILFYCQEPAQPFEEKYKIKKLNELGKKYKISVHFIKHEPGLFRYDRAFKKKPGTELGWGAQTTLLTLLALPFVYWHQARYILSGTENLNNLAISVNGWKTYISADQTSANSALKNSMTRILTNNQCEAKNMLEPLEEISIFYLLHHRYPEIAKHIFSCEATKPLYGGTQWCHNCSKCSQMYLYGVCCGFEPKELNFKEDLLNKPGLYSYCFEKGLRLFSVDDWDFPFYWLYKKGRPSIYINQFKKKLNNVKPWSWYCNFFSAAKKSSNLPREYEDKMMRIFNEELKNFKKIMPK